VLYYYYHNLQGISPDLKIYHRRINKDSATGEALRVRHRKYLLKQRARIKRKYNKLNLGFWVGGGKKSIVAKSKLSSYRIIKTK
jgi:hypothetical protein